MPFYKNKVNRKITIFLRNAIRIEFQPYETIELETKGLHLQHANYLDLVTPDEINRARAANLKENVETVTPEPKKVEINEKQILEVKEPTKNKELLTEPVKEGTGVKKSRKKKTLLTEKKKKVSDGYNQLKKEVTVATSGK